MNYPQDIWYEKYVNPNINARDDRLNIWDQIGQLQIDCKGV